MLSRTIYKKRRGRRLMTAMAGVLLISGTFFVSSVALAATPNAGLFELDGNAISSTGSGGARPDDWDRVCHEATDGAICASADNTHGATAVSWASDTHGAVPPLAACTGTNCTIFTGGGSKDPQDINQWAWKDDAGGLPDKDNLLHSFAARYSIDSSADCPGVNGDTTGATKCEMLFFGNDRFDNSGDAQEGFWFFQNKIGLGTNAVGGGQGFTSSGAPEFHRTGDLLLISNFSNGGTTSTITVYSWDTTCKKAVNNAGPGQCGDANLRVLATSTNAKCSPADAAISGFCGIVNAGTVTQPWPFLDKSGTPTNQALNGEFYEGGVNLSSLGLGSECFASVASESRSSTSTTAVLKDFVLGSFGECGSEVVTTPQTGAGGAITDGIDANDVPDLSIGTGSVVVRDRAVVTVTGTQTWAGSVAFTLCGPLDLTPTDTNCASGGTAIPYVAPANGNVTNAAPAVNSPNTTLTSVGRYCWRAVFTATTANVPNDVDPELGSTSTTECFEVLPVQPTMTTDASGPVAAGGTLSDTATISSLATAPGTNGIGPDLSINATNGATLDTGSITWRAFGPGSGGCTDIAMSATSRAVKANGTYPKMTPPENQAAVSFTANAAGKYTFVAKFDSSTVNNLSIGESACPDLTGTEEAFVGNSSTTTTPKNGAGEDFTDTNTNGVKDLSIGTGSVNAKDSATVSVTGISPWAGTVQFYICGPLAYAPTSTDCASGGVAVGSPVAVSNGAATVTSDTTSFTRAARYCWRAEFTSTTTGVPNSKDGSTTECFEVLPVTPTLATVAGPDVVLGTPITDTATLVGTANQPGTNGIGSDGSINATNGAAAGGTISFVVKKGATCDTTALVVTGSPVTVSGDRDRIPDSDFYGPVSATPTTLGLYTFVATYSGNGPNTNGTGPSACPEGTEEVIVTGTSSLSTAQNWLPNDTATLTGDANLTGTLVFKLYTGDNCGATSGAPVAGQEYTVPVSGAASGSTFSTSNLTFKVTVGASYSWLVTYDDATLTDPAPSCEKSTLTITN